MSSSSDFRSGLPPADLRDAFPARPFDLHKYSAGVVTVVGGSSRFIHAPALAGLGARAAGAGLVQLVVPDASRIAAGALVPEATFMKQTATCVPPKADATAIGMGLGVSPASEMLVSRLLSGSAGRFVLDADALAVLAKWYAHDPAKFPATTGQTLVLTPHAGEAARLLACRPEEIAADRAAAARQIAARYRAVTVLKGPHTIVTTPDGALCRVCEAGNPFMALGGMGDLLAGMIAARWAYLARAGDPHGKAVRNAEEETALAFRAAAAAVWLHAAAADRLVYAETPEDPSLVNVAHAVATLRVLFERTRGEGAGDVGHGR